MSERDELLHTLNEIQEQKQDVLHASQEVTQKFSTTQAEVSDLEKQMACCPKPLTMQSHLHTPEIETPSLIRTLS